MIKKMLMVVVLFLALVIPTRAGFQYIDKFQVRLGPCWYHELLSGNDYRDSVVNSFGVYMQIPIYEWKGVGYLSAGVVTPIPNVARTRPEFSISTRVGYLWHGCPQWLNVELGAYVMVSPRIPVGVQIGLVNIRF